MFIISTQWTWKLSNWTYINPITLSHREITHCQVWGNPCYIDNNELLYNKIINKHQIAKKYINNKCTFLRIVMIFRHITINYIFSHFLNWNWDYKTYSTLVIHGFINQSFITPPKKHRHVCPPRTLKCIFHFFWPLVWFHFCIIQRPEIANDLIIYQFLHIHSHIYLLYYVTVAHTHRNDLTDYQSIFLTENITFVLSISFIRKYNSVFELPYLIEHIEANW